MQYCLIPPFYWQLREDGDPALAALEGTKGCPVVKNWKLLFPGACVSLVNIPTGLANSVREYSTATTPCHQSSMAQCVPTLHRVMMA